VQNGDDHHGNIRFLDPQVSLRLFNHSPTGFEWGYAGSGPAQLALAILADLLGDAAEALRLHQEFKFLVVARLPYDGWELTEAQVLAALEQIKTEAAR
jgi:hypothetical protein